MFNLKRSFFKTSFFLLLSVMLVSSATDLYTELKELEDRRKNLSRSQVTPLVRALWPVLEPKIAHLSTIDSQALKDDAVIGEIGKVFDRYMLGGLIYKLKLYDLNGITLYSVDSAQISEDKNSNALLQRAVQGEVASHIVFKEKVPVEHGVLVDRYISETYMPIKDPQGNIVAIVEAYSDATEDRAETLLQVAIMTVVTSLTTFVLWLLLCAIILRADRIMKEQSESNRKLSAAIHEFEGGFMITEANAQGQHMLSYANKSMLDHLRMSEGDYQGQPVSAILDGLGASDEQRSDLAKCLENNLPFNDSICSKGPDGSESWVSIRTAAAYNAEFSTHTSVWIVQDVTQRSLAEAKIRQLALQDVLTGLPNRSLFNQLLDYSVDQAQSRNEALAVMFMDLDRFKQVNDTLGHEAGDILLKQVSQRLQDSLASSDLLFIDHEFNRCNLARLGGDEFTLVLPNIGNKQAASKVAQRLIDELSRPFDLGCGIANIGASIGIVITNDDKNIDGSELLRRADSALYWSKSAGRNCFNFYEGEVQEQLSTQQIIENDLAHAIERNELHVCYQPQLSTHDERVIGSEALLRWTHPAMGNVTPDQFIPIAESSGLIKPIGRWVLREACQQAALWYKQGLDLSIAVNLSPVQLQDSDIIKMVSDILDETQLPAAKLQLELTESMLMDMTPVNLAILEDLRAMGISIALDDFGSGFSSLNYLSRLPVDKLKLDRSFVQHIVTNERDYEVVSSMVDLGRRLKMKINVEGVEDRDQYRAIEKLGVSEVQGFLFSKALKTSEFEDFVNASNQNFLLSKTI